MSGTPATVALTGAGIAFAEHPYDHDPAAASFGLEAAAALGEIASADAEPFLALVANDPDPDVRKNARWALQQIAARKAKAGS